ncbi:CLUMA_CG004701, isoform A [Clunio marinus]|uniref:CLUMA_CG004701, isoform A n=1 Tax=Clunio marinus TaxID=568069 RepID=A0A1J1HSN3_9DIPT|nr:CLUMA_CG004701, isoform A [Clunio marinus]
MHRNGEAFPTHFCLLIVPPSIFYSTLLKVMSLNDDLWLYVPGWVFPHLFFFKLSRTHVKPEKVSKRNSHFFSIELNSRRAAGKNEEEKKLMSKKKLFPTLF